jgi:hypothetical protein
VWNYAPRTVTYNSVILVLAFAWLGITGNLMFVLNGHFSKKGLMYLIVAGVLLLVEVLALSLVIGLYNNLKTATYYVFVSLLVNWLFFTVCTMTQQYYQMEKETKKNIMVISMAIPALSIAGLCFVSLSNPFAAEICMSISFLWMMMLTWFP